MARRNDLPSVFTRLHSRFFTPYWAILGTGVLMAVLVLFVDLMSVVAISTFGLLFNYSVTNISAFKLKTGHHRHKVLPLLGLATCLMLLAFILFASPQAWLAGVAFLAAGTVYYALRKRFGHQGEKKPL
jgi:amino acid transporter